MKQKIWFIINPTSGISNKKRIESYIRKNLDKGKFDFSIQYTSYKDHGSEIAKKGISEKIDVICAVGGDGTVHEIAVALIHSKVKLAIIPCGSGNGFARHFKITERVKKSIEIINTGNFSKIDTCLVNDLPFIQVAGIGYDAKIAFDMVNNKIRGLVKYLILILKSYFSYNGIALTLDNKTANYFMVTVANTKEFGNGFQISPTSHAADGQLELVLVKKATILDFPFQVLRFLYGNSNKSKYVTTIQFTELQFSTNSSYFQMDGEGSRNETTEFYYRVVPQSLFVIHP